MIGLLHVVGLAVKIQALGYIWIADKQQITWDILNTMFFSSNI